MTFLPLAIAVARIHINRADEEDRRRAERDASNQAEATSSQAPLSAPSRACRPYVRKPSLVELLAECRDQVRPDLVGTCNRVGIEVAVLPLRADLAGYIDCERELFVLNADTTSMRRRFTLAHQMAHWVWHHNFMRPYGGTNDGLDLRGVPGAARYNPVMPVAEEIFATKIAIGLIMSEEVLRGLHAKGLGAAEIAERLDAAPRAIQMRFEHLGLEARA